MVSMGDRENLSWTFGKAGSGRGIRVEGRRTGLQADDLFSKIDPVC